MLAPSQPPRKLQTSPGADRANQAGSEHDVIEAHRKAALDHNEAERIQFGFDAGGKTGERREEYDRLVALDNVAWGR